MLEQRKMAYELKKDFYYNINVNYTYQQNQLPELKNEFPEYKIYIFTGTSGCCK
ncbi:MAG: hypothetical protein AMDU4_FER2C00057G0008 [Ferroplasma sp. Type II]|nr:MAG: hypothetical protein AMDU4_FER2C00057G0008 [Ferroplasma sp. Type II]